MTIHTQQETMEVIYVEISVSYCSIGNTTVKIDEDEMPFIVKYNSSLYDKP